MIRSSARTRWTGSARCASALARTSDAGRAPGDGERDLRRARRPGPAGGRRSGSCCLPMSSPTSAAVTATRSRLAKVDAIAQCLSRAAPDEIPIVVSYLSGELRQRRTGVGWASLRDLPPPATEADAERRGGGSGVRGRGGRERAGIRRAPARHARHAVRAGDRGGAAVPGAARRWGAAARGARGHHGGRGGARGRCGRRGRPARGDARGRPPRGRARRARGRRRGARAVPSGGRPARSADAREDGRVGAERDRTDRRCGHGRLEARRRADPGAPRRRRGRRLHPDARPDHGACARGRGGGARAPGQLDRPRRRGDRAPSRRTAASVPGDREPSGEPRGRRDPPPRGAAHAVLLRRAPPGRSRT